MRQVVSIILTLLCIGALFAEEAAKPHEFVAGQVISAVNMNDNFDTLYNLVNGNINNANLKSDSNALFKVSGGLMAASNSNVGIGTYYPQVRFQINYPSSQGTGTITAVDTGVLGSGTQFLTELEVGDEIMVGGEGRIVTVITDDAYLQINEAFIGEVDNDGFTYASAFFGVTDEGSVGIGTINPTEKLDVIGVVKATSFLGDGSNLDGIVINEDDPEVGVNTTGYVPKWDGSALVTGSIYDDGNVGIGNTSPNAKVDISGTGEGNYLPVLTVRNTGTSGTYDGNVIRAISNNPVNGSIDGLMLNSTEGNAFHLNFVNASYYYAGRIGTVFSNHSATPLGELFFSTGQGSNDPIEVMRLTSTGNVGIGNTNPANKLDVAGTIQATGFKMPTGAGDGLVLTSDAAGVGTWQTPSGGIDGSGTANYIPKFIDADIIGDSAISESGGNVGIGTTSVGYPLHIAGIGTLLTGDAYGFMSAHRTAGSIGVILGGDIGTGYGVIAPQPGSNVGLTFYSRWGGGWQERMVLASDGNLGIGTTNPSELLHVYGTGGTKYILSEVGSENTVGFKIKRSGTGTASEWALYSPGGSTDFRIWNGEDRITVDNEGNVGIGTANPGFLTHIYKTDNSIQTLLALENPDTGNASAVRAVLLGQGNYASWIAYGDNHATDANIVDFGATSMGSSLALLASDSRTMWIDTTGNVGIGTVEPGYELVVSGDSDVSIVSQANTETGVARFQLGDNSTLGTTLSWDGDNDRAQWSTNSHAYPMIIGNEWMYFKSDGNVGLGTTNPTARLEVIGTIRTQNAPIYTEENGGIINSIGYPGSFQINNNQVLSIMCNSTKCFTINDGGGRAAFVFADYSSSSIIFLANPSNLFEASSTPSSGKFGIYKSANDHTIYIKSNAPAGQVLSILFIGDVSNVTGPQ